MSTEPPAVTVVVPTFNRLAYLRAALASLEAQSFRDFELIVLDDGSSDGTAEFLSVFNPWFPVRVVRFNGRERAFLRNEGARTARGQLVAFLDDDDVWMPAKLERQVEFMRARPSVGMSYCHTTAIDSLGNVDESTTRAHRALYRSNQRRGHSFEALTRHCLIFTSSVMVTREAFEVTGGFGEDCVGGEDWDFYLKVARKSTMDVLPEELVLYRVHPGNSAAGDRERRIRTGDGRMRAAMRQLHEVDGSKARALLLRAIAQNHYWADRNAESFRYSLLALRESPTTFASPSNLLMLAKSAIKAAR